MKSPLRLACLAALLPAPAFAAEPTTVDVYRELVRSRTAAVGVENALDYDTRRFRSIFLENPDSQYSNLRDDPPILNAIWWYDFVDNLAIDTSDKGGEALTMLQWQSGFTKARPGVDVAVDAEAAWAYRGREAAANAIKAGVDVDIFWKARDMNGAMSTAAAGYAVALQLLRDQVRSHAPESYEARGIKPGVLARYLRLDNPQNLDEGDQDYLADLLRHAVSKQGFTVDADGHRQLPAAYRVARVAAAYADAGGYLNPYGYCRGNEPRPEEPGGWDDTAYGGPLCFIAATDRAVQAWFRRQMRHEASSVRSAHQRGDRSAGDARLRLANVLLLVDLAGFVEIGTAALVEEMGAEGALAEDEVAIAEERVNQLTCRIRP
jgi:hypothetical protein